MAEDKGPKKSGTDSVPGTNQISALTISPPKGGGAIRGSGEKFSASPVTEPGSMSGQSFILCPCEYFIVSKVPKYLKF